LPAALEAVTAARLRAVAAASADSRLGHVDVRVLAYVVAARLDPTTGMTEMSAEQVASALGIAEPTARRALRRLVAAGYLSVHPTPDGGKVIALAAGFKDGQGRRYRAGRRAPWAFDLRQEPLPFPGVAPVGMTWDQVVVCATFAIAHDLNFKRSVARLAARRSPQFSTAVCRLGRKVIGAMNVGRRVPSGWQDTAITDDQIEELRRLLEHDDASVFQGRTGAT
jgi:DNA-binding transcriptional ArsR family regulator